MQNPNFPKNCWWVAARSEEITRQPFNRWLLETPVVLYRTEDGGIAALEDRCPHRWAPLSKGCLVGDDIMCPYHGFQFDSNGRCVNVPTQEKIPSLAKVDAFPIREAGDFVWIWFGDAELADTTPLPDLAFLSDPAWNTLSGYMPVGANYFLIQENVLDLTHFGFLHADTLDQKGWESGDSDVSTDDGRVGYRKPINQQPVAPFLGIPDDIAFELLADRVDWGYFVTPAAHHAGVDLQDPRDVTRQRALHFQITHLTTPESKGRTHYWWAVGHDYGNYTDARRAQLTKVIVDTFSQDKDVLEAIQTVIDRDYRHADSVEVSVLADRPALQARRIMHGMLEKSC